MLTLFSEVDYSYRAETIAFRAALAGNADSITDIQAMALDRLIRDLNGEFNPHYATANLWNKFTALYPILGGTATAHRWNLKDLRDLDAAYRITWVNNPTHNATGVQFDGTTNYGQLHTTGLTVHNNDFHLSFYNRNPNIKGYVDMGDSYSTVGLGANWNPPAHKGGSYPPLSYHATWEIIVAIADGENITSIPTAGMYQQNLGMFTGTRNSTTTTDFYYRDGSTDTIIFQKVLQQVVLVVIIS